MTIQPDINSAIAHLDYTEYGCNCPCHPCANRATHIVHIHALHCCNEPGLEFGNRVELRCFECLLRLWGDVHRRLKRQWAIGECATCGAPVAELRDVVRDWELL